MAAGLTAVIVLIGTCCSKAKSSSVSKGPPPIPQLSVATVVQEDVPIYAESIGTTEGFINAKILPKISGYLLKQDYRDGAHVSSGELLFEIDDRPYKATLDQALGTLAQQQAQLKQNQQQLTRYTRLVKAGVISRQEFDTMTQTTRATAGQVKTAQAAVEAAKLNLEWTKVYLPIDGVAGIAQAQVGDLVNTTTLLTTVSQLDPIKVSFPISEKEYLHFAGRINARENGTAAGGGVPFELILGNGTVYAHHGHFYAANRQIDAQTGTIQIQAIFPNPEDLLRPGMYAKIRAQIGVRRDALMVPQSAVFEIQGQYEIATVGTDNRIMIHSVKPGKKVDALWLIDQGVNPGERVVTDGVQDVKNGMQIRPVLARKASLSPPAAPIAGTASPPNAGSAQE